MDNKQFESNQNEIENTKQYEDNPNEISNDSLNKENYETTMDNSEQSECQNVADHEVVSCGKNEEISTDGNGEAGAANEEFSNNNRWSNTDTDESDRIEEPSSTNAKNERRMDMRKEKRPVWRSVVGSILAGVIGSAATLTVLPYTNYFELQNEGASIQKEAIEQTTDTASSASTVNAQPVSATTSNSIADIVEQSSQAIVGVANYSNQQSNPFAQQSSQEVTTATGTGFVYKVSGNEVYIATNNHVIEGASKIEVSLYNGDVVTAELVGTDALTDIAVLKITGSYDITALPFGDSSSLRAGDEVIAIGNPLGLDLSRTVTQGIISAVDRTITASTSAGEWDMDVIQTDAAINAGNSGGPLLNSSGQVIGINSMKISEEGVEGLGFAIPSEQVLTIIEQLEKTGNIERPYLGVSLASLREVPPYYLQNVNTANVSEGALVTSVDENSAAGKAGLAMYDIIVSVNGEKVSDTDSLRKLLYTEHKVGDTVRIEFYHEGQLKSVNVTLTSNQVN
ncbi:S1C family serine protease [Caldibacillus lycopersici]|uniref:S1C family serine protease n=1 Tax=Perspicuibacillus lycopersici TaxID=1325689 RepID=A0AAE3LRS1_9BACI|nr:S1C family serine protease [Perspicuibacillus lycopersici]MCU9614979.1 S1C family serine protease [Perspicuibacillus lycopersici]